jgi:hypothetical protein
MHASRFALSISFLVLISCGGEVNVGGPQNDSGPHSSQNRSGGSGAPGGSNSSGSGIGNGADSGVDGASGDMVDAGIPDPFPTTCAQFTFVLDPDAAANTCAFTPADVVCNSNADCTTYIDNSGCGCFDPIYGVNTANTVKCFAPPCAAPLSADGGVYTCPVDASGLYTQDCQFVPDSQNVTVACVKHQCLTLAAAPGSE